MASDRSSPTTANASVLAARNRRRSGAASSELVIVRWRHSPLMPTTARMMMKSPLVSAVNTSVRTLSCVGSVSRLTRPAMSSEVPTASPGEGEEGACGAQLQHLGPQQRGHDGSAVSSKKASSSERDTATSSVRASPWSAASRPTRSGVVPRAISAPLCGSDANPGLGENPGQALRLGRAHPGDRAVRSAQHLLQRAAGPERAVRDHHHVVHALGHLGEQVAGHEHRAAPRGLGAEQVAHPADAGRVEPVGGLVENEHLGVAQQRGCDREALAHSHRVALDAAVRRCREPDPVQHLVHARVGMAPGGGQHAQVVAAAAARVEARVLEHHPDLSARMRKVLVAPSVEGSAARVGMDQAEEHAQGRALARPVGAQEPRDPSRLHLEREVGHGIHLAEALGEPVDLHGRVHWEHPRRAPDGAHREKVGTRPPTSG